MKILEYQKSDGSLFWKYPNNTRRLATYEKKPYGYAKAYLDMYDPTSQKCKRAHRVVWEMHNGSIPHDRVIDHINGDGTDNRIENLRLATRAQNSMNRKINKNNSSGYKGVVESRNAQRNLCEKPWRVWMQINGKYYSKRGFATAEEAASHYNKKAVEFYGEFASLNEI